MALNQNPIQYSSRTYNTIMNDINSDSTLAPKPNWFKRLIAGLGDTISIWLNSVANMLFLRTAYTRGAVQDLCQLIDYYLSGQVTSSGIELFHVDTSLGAAIYPFTLTVADLKAKSQGSLNVSSLQFEARASVTFTDVNDTFTTNFAVNSELTVSVDFGYTGHKCRVSSTVTLPSPLLANKDYYIIYVSATKIKLALSVAAAFAGSAITITADGAGVHTLQLYSKAVTVYQQKTIAAAVVIGRSDGLTEWQEFDLPDLYVIDDTLAITINSVTWTLVDTLVNSISTDTHYKLYQKANGNYTIRFGNGTYGAIPGAFDIYAEYATGGGINSNMALSNLVNVYAGTSIKISGCTNSGAMTGGADQESIVNAKIVAPLLLKARDRFVTVDDGIAIVLAYGGISQCQIIPNFYGYLSCKVIGIATGGGNPSSGVKAAIQQELIDKSILSSINVNFVDATITATDVVSDAHMKSGYAWADVEPYFTLAWTLFLSEIGNEILNDYLSNGIESATTMINTYFSTAFTSADYVQIAALLDNFTPRQFGDTLQESQAFSFIEANVEGIDYMTITSIGGGAFPVALAADEITTEGTLTLGEIP